MVTTDFLRSYGADCRLKKSILLKLSISPRIGLLATTTPTSVAMRVKDNANVIGSEEKIEGLAIQIPSEESHLDLQNH